MLSFDWLLLGVVQLLSAVAVSDRSVAEEEVVVSEEAVELLGESVGEGRGSGVGSEGRTT